MFYSLKYVVTGCLLCLHRTMTVWGKLIFSGNSTVTLISLLPWIWSLSDIIVQFLCGMWLSASPPPPHLPGIRTSRQWLKTSDSFHWRWGIFHFDAQCKLFFSWVNGWKKRSEGNAREDASRRLSAPSGPMWAQSNLARPNVWQVRPKSSPAWSGLQICVSEERFGALVLKLWPGIIQFHEDHLRILFIRLSCCLWSDATYILITKNNKRNKVWKFNDLSER